jgi:SAM-dependent methyltransferase
MNWNHGYYADSGYTYGYYAETMPNRLRWAALIQGHQSKSSGFRYLDAGCGQGLSLILAAASHPDSEFIGIDFLPEHIAHATELARRCGLTNVKFIEGDFIELANNPSSLGQFDYAVCHGITTWIAPEVKKALFSLIGRVLKPAGIFYNSYNTYPGWLSGVPFQHLVLLEQRSKPGWLALKNAQHNMDRLKEQAPTIFSALPDLSLKLESLETKDPVYLVQEYNNQFWNPVFVSQMMDEMAAVKLSYLGSATLPEAYDIVLAPKIRELLAEQSVPAVREQLRDYSLNQSFRRDLYVKGQSRPWQRELHDQLREIRFVINPMTKRPEAGKPFLIKAGGVELNGDSAFYGGILDQLGNAQEGLTVGDLVDHQDDIKMKNSVVSAVSMLLHQSWVAIYDASGDADKSGQKCNAALGEAICDGAPYRYICLPRLGGAVPLSDVEWIVLQQAQDKVPQSQWESILTNGLMRLGREILKDGKPLPDSEERQKIVKEVLREFAEVKLPFFKQTGGCV